jgi:hypothetical protein
MAQSTLPTRWRVLHSPPVLPKESRSPLIRICETHRFVGRSRLGSPRGEGEDERAEEGGPEVKYYWVGFDVAKAFHWVSVVDDEGNEVLSRRVEATEEDLDALCSEIARLDDGERRVAIDLVGGPAALLEAVPCGSGSRADPAHHPAQGTPFRGIPGS